LASIDPFTAFAVNSSASAFYVSLGYVKQASLHFVASLRAFGAGDTTIFRGYCSPPSMSRISDMTWRPFQVIMISMELFHQLKFEWLPPIFLTC
jgi:hypothetical protein